MAKQQPISEEQMTTAYQQKIDELLDRVARLSVEKAEALQRAIDAEAVRDHWHKKYSDLVAFHAGKGTATDVDA